jgi:superfamily II RNA helicase
MNNNYDFLYKDYPFVLDEFQKEGIKNIYLGNNVLVTAGTGSGKCHGINTPILMYNGSIKMVQDVKVGEKIMGDDSTPRTVLSLARGRETLYKVILSDKTEFVCNKSHILCLKYNVKPSISFDKRRKHYVINYFDNKTIKLKFKSFTDEENAKKFLQEKTEQHKSKFNITINDYLKLSKKIKRNSLSYRVPITFPSKDVPLDPYIVGLWLGDGTSREPEITNQDAPILKYLSNKVKDYDCYLQYKSGYNYRINSIKGRNNYFWNQMCNLNLKMNKHIPYIYKCNTRKIRLQILAGLVDSDGYYNNNNNNNKYYEIIQKNTTLANDIVYLSRSLGFQTTIKKTLKSCVYKGVKKEAEYNRISISGDNLQEIPVLCKRKLGEKRSINKPSLDYFFTLNEIGEDNYYGFQLDGNKQYVLGNFVVTHNTTFAEYAIRKSFQNNKKCIFTSPIKALSNQKYSDFKKKFKNMSVGILTGDIKSNIDADVLIMTTEILRNLLYKENYKYNKIDIDLDIKNDVDCIVFDEVHYINDKDRGKVWEETLIMLPQTTTIVMLSATISNPSDLCEWLDTIKDKKCIHVNKEKRVVPLTHYLYYGCPHTKKNKEHNLLITKHGNKLKQIMDNDYNFNDITYHNVRKLMEANNKLKNNYHNKHNIRSLILHMKSKKLLPCLFFVFSRRKCQNLANNIEVCLNDTKEQRLVEKIIDDKINTLLNPDIYKNTNEYFELKKILCKGIGYHHSGLMTIFKEIVEMLYTMGLIKVLFCTETFAIGLNCPVKTVVMTDMKKYTNGGLRNLLSSEYKQISGRAGRRGIDKIGTVILLANVFDLPEINTIKGIMCAPPERITSKFSFDYNFILKMLNYKDFDFDKFLTNTFLNKDNNIKRLKLITEKNIIEEHIRQLNISKQEKVSFDKYYNSQIKINDGEKLTKGEKKNNKNINSNETLYNKYLTYLNNYELYEDCDRITYTLQQVEDNILGHIKNKVSFLRENDYITEDNKLKIKGLISSQICEIDEIILTEIFMSDILKTMNEMEICGLIGLFFQTKCLSDENRVYNEDELDISQNLNVNIKKVRDILDNINANEEKLQIFSNRELNYDMVEYFYKWACGTEFNNLYYDNYRGIFIKDILRLDNIIQTLEIMSLNIGDITLYNKINNIHDLILRNGIVFESLYIRE